MSFILDVDREHDAAVLQTESTGVPRKIEHARRYLNYAYALWSILDPQKAARLRSILDNELITPEGDDEVLRLSRDLVGRLVALLDGIEYAGVGEITGVPTRYHVLPEKFEYLQRVCPELVRTNQLSNGRLEYVIDELTYVEWLRNFLQTALRLNVDVLQD